jgi:NADH-quinone oxidoreductase subunit J
MLTTLDFSENLKTVTVNMLPASILSGAVAVLLIYLFSTAEWTTTVPVDREDTMFDLGLMLMSEYLLPFQIAGVLLLVAIIGALLMSTRNRNEP